MREGYVKVKMNTVFCVNNECKMNYKNTCILSYKHFSGLLLYPSITDKMIKESKEKCEHFKEGKCKWYEEDEKHLGGNYE